MLFFTYILTARSCNLISSIKMPEKHNALLIKSIILIFCLFFAIKLCARNVEVEAVRACVVTDSVVFIGAERENIAKCLGWEINDAQNICLGSYKPLNIEELDDPTAVRIVADAVSLYPSGISKLTGNVSVQQKFRVVSAQTAKVYRDAR